MILQIKVAEVKTHKNGTTRLIYILRNNSAELCSNGNHVQGRDLEKFASQLYDVNYYTSVKHE